MNEWVPAQDDVADQAAAEMSRWRHDPAHSEQRPELVRAEVAGQAVLGQGDRGGGGQRAAVALDQPVLGPGGRLVDVLEDLDLLGVRQLAVGVDERQPAAANDLNSIKPGEFGDNIISETLVEILVKQGKKERAIEVLKKLIWKYPQKKAYFASQIEDLRK
jgi:hypothetical protein